MAEGWLMVVLGVAIWAYAKQLYAPIGRYLVRQQGGSPEDYRAPTLALIILFGLAWVAGGIAVVFVG